MLVLARKKNERIIITHAGCEIVVEFIEVKNGVVRLGITAPPEVRIDREEVHVRRDQAQTTVWGDMPIGGDDDRKNTG